MKPEPQFERPAADTFGQTAGKGRPYAKPQLIEYGSVAKLTRGTKSGDGEITPTAEKMKCL